MEKKNKLEDGEYYWFRWNVIHNWEVIYVLDGKICFMGSDEYVNFSSCSCGDFEKIDKPRR